MVQVPCRIRWNWRRPSADTEWRRPCTPSAQENESNRMSSTTLTSITTTRMANRNFYGHRLPIRKQIMAGDWKKKCVKSLTLTVSWARTAWTMPLRMYSLGSVGSTCCISCGTKNCESMASIEDHKKQQSMKCSYPLGPSDTNVWSI